MPFVTLGEYIEFTGDEDELDQTALFRVERLLATAQSVVQRYTGQRLEFVADDTATFLVPWGDLFLPEIPVTAVDELNADGTVLDLTGFSWTLDGILSPNRSYTWGSPQLLEVTYSHGYAEIPADIKHVCIQWVERMRANPLGHRWESTGPYSISVADPTDGLTTGQRDLLDGYRRLAIA